MRGAVLCLLAAGMAALAQEQHTEYTRTRFEVIVPLLRQQRLAEAEQLTRELLAKAEAQLPAGSLEIGRILNLQTDIAVRLGKGELAETVIAIQRSSEIKNKMLGEDSDEAIQTALLYSAVLNKNARMADAERIFDNVARALERTNRIAGPALTNSLNSMATQLLERGHPQRARIYSERAVEMAERIFGPESADTARVISTLGFVQQALGELASASVTLERAMKVYEKTLGPGHRFTIASYNNLATQFRQTGKYAEARRLFDQANAAREQLLGPDHLHNAIGQHNLGNLLMAMGDYAGARIANEKALALRLRTIGESRYLTGTTLSAMAETLYFLQDYPAALSYSERALKALLASTGEHHPYYIAALDVHALILGRMGSAVAAFNTGVIAARLRTQHIRLSTQGMAENAALSFAVQPEYNGADMALSLSMGDYGLGVDAAREAWDLRIRSRALVLDEMSARRRFATSLPDLELERLHQSLLGVRRGLSHLVLTAGSEEGSAARISELLAKKQKLERQLGAHSASLRRDFERADIGLAEVAAALPARSALVAFVSFTKHPERQSWIAAFVLRSGSEEPALLSIGPVAEIDRTVAEWRSKFALVAADPSRAGKRVESLARVAGEAVRKQIWDPVEALVRGVDLVFVVPDGPLHLVNLAALPVGVARYLVESGPTIHTLGTERDLVVKDVPRAASSTLLALANPAFDGVGAPRDSRNQGMLMRSATPACSDLRRVRFQALPASGVEAAEIARMWTGGTKPIVLNGVAANEAGFRAKAPGQRVVHLATHGFLLGQQCGAEGLIGEAALQSPLVLSGLALAGANRRDKAREDEEDGLLTAEEIAGLNLEGVEWVVLSGCDTGLGQIRGAEGVLGLRRAFQTAGAATVIVSLWPVEDTAAREWMRALYESRFKRNQSTAESLREASRMTLKARRASGRSTHPFFWAAFVGAGDWR